MIAEQPEPEIPEDAEPESGQQAGYTPAPAQEWDRASDSFPADQHDFSAIGAIRYDDEDDEPPRRRLWAWIAGLVFLVFAAAAAFYFFAPPELKARAGIAEAGGSPLQLMLTASDRQKLASGNELLAISGRVINSTDREQAVPPIHAELRNPATNALVYQWTIAPPARSLAPGAAASFNSAEVDVPEGGESLSLRFAS